MKIGIFHDYFGSIGGGEKTAITLAKVLDADIITTDIDAFSPDDKGIRVKKLRNTIKKSPLKQISASWSFSNCNFCDDYDFFIFTGNWSIHGAAIHQPNLWYCYTPTRAFYDNYQNIHDSMRPIARLPFKTWTSLHRRWNENAIKSINTIVSISKTVAERVEKYLHRDSQVIYPPVDTKQYSCREYGDFWLSVNRIYPEKRIDLQINAFRSLPDEKLVIAGGYAKGDHAAGYAKRVLENLPPNVTYAGEVSEEEVLDLYSRCKGHITTALHEDFGLTPVEAMASGKPVVAVHEGGYRETVTKKTGMLVPVDVNYIRSAILSISEKPETYKSECLEQAAKFDISHFSKEIKGRIFSS